MFWTLLLSLLIESPLGQHYLADPSPRTPLLPRLARPMAAGGWLPPPRRPSEAYVLKALAGTGRTPGDLVVSHRLEREQLTPPKVIRGVGRARVWTLTYRYEVVGPDGPHTLYVDRTALVREP